MNKCNEYLDMISAYADGELAERDARSVEAHIGVCEKCSALLELYREISIAADESAVPVPDALRIGVMNTIRNEKSPVEIKRKAKLRIVLTRYMPIAACLAVALFAWGYWSDLFGLRSGGGTNFSAFDSGGGAPENALYANPHPEADTRQESDEGELTNEQAPGGASGNGFGDDSADPHALPPHASTDGAGGVDSPSSAADANAGNRNSPVPNEPVQKREMPWTLVEDDSPRTLKETSFIEDVLNKASYWIVITGDFPEGQAQYLASYRVTDYGVLFGWEMIFEIPSSDVQMFLEKLQETNAHQAVSNTNYNAMSNSAMPNAQNAIVLYSPDE